MGASAGAVPIPLPSEWQSEPVASIVGGALADLSELTRIPPERVLDALAIAPDPVLAISRERSIPELVWPAMFRFLMPTPLRQPARHEFRVRSIRILSGDVADIYVEDRADSNWRTSLIQLDLVEAGLLRGRVDVPAGLAAARPAPALSLPSLRPSDTTPRPHPLLRRALVDNPHDLRAWLTAALVREGLGELMGAHALLNPRNGGLVQLAPLEYTLPPRMKRARAHARLAAALMFEDPTARVLAWELAPGFEGSVAELRSLVGAATRASLAPPPVLG